MVHTCRIWTWDGSEDMARERTLVITKTLGKNPKVRYSFSNGGVEEYTAEEYAYFRTQKYWMERTFDDSKNELGLSDYQIRTGRAGTTTIRWSSWPPYS